MKQIFDLQYKIGQRVYYRHKDGDARLVVIRGLEVRLHESGKMYCEFSVSPPEYPEFSKHIYGWSRYEKIAASLEELNAPADQYDWMKEDDE